MSEAPLLAGDAVVRADGSAGEPVHEAGLRPHVDERLVGVAIVVPEGIRSGGSSIPASPSTRTAIVIA